MINLRYHIVSLTAVFLAIGIGLTIGSTFLDQATVDNLEGQLGSLESSLDNRDTRIENLESDLAETTALSAALDEQGAGLLTERLVGIPVVVVAARGADEPAVRGALQTLVVAGAEVEGIWWVTDQFILDEDGQIADLANALGEDSTDPSRLRRMAIDALGGELRARQLLGIDPDPVEDVPVDVPPVDETTVPVDSVPVAEEEPDVIDSLFAAGFLEFEAVPGGPETPEFVNGARLLIAGGSSVVPDDLVLEPLVARMARASTTPVLAVIGSAGRGDRVMSDAVSVIRQDETLRTLVSTVDTIEHFDGWAAMVLAFADLDDEVVGHYGLDEGATRLLPPLRTP